MTGPAITVTAVDYQFTGMPTSVPVGTTLTLQNSGTEVHEMVVIMKNPGVTQSWDELLQMSGTDAFLNVAVVSWQSTSLNSSTGVSVKVIEPCSNLKPVTK